MVKDQRLTVCLCQQDTGQCPPNSKALPGRNTEYVCIAVYRYICITLYLHIWIRFPKAAPIYKIYINVYIKRSFRNVKTLLAYIKNSFYALQRAFLRAGDRPNAKAFGASGSQVTPDSSARSAGLRPFLVYRKYTLPHRNSFKGRFWYTQRYTVFLKYCLTGN